MITSINASNILAGSIPPSRIFGNYPLITGLGTLTSGTWNATPIEDEYIAGNPAFPYTR